MHLAGLSAIGFIAASTVNASSAQLKQKRVSSAPNESVVVYWGQGDGSSQIPLIDVCNNPSIDIVILAFLHVFPDQGLNGYPGTNFASACNSTTFSTPNGLPTQLLSECSEIEPGIQTCQNAGKKVLLSLGGASPGNYYLESQASAKSFANFLWGAFGPNQNGTYPRPFGNAVIDGFDLDIESTGVTSTQKQQYYPDLISQLRENYGNYDTDERTWYISGAPQCIIPDAHFSNYISSSWFDYIFVQLFNTDICSARSYIDNINSGTFAEWLSQGYANSNTRVYAGLPANLLAANGGSSGGKYYLAPSELKTFVTSFTGSAKFAGIMLWEASFSAKNIIDGHDYAWWVKSAINDAVSGVTGFYPSGNTNWTTSSTIALSTTSVV